MNTYSDNKAQTNTDSNITKVTQEATQKQETETTTAEKKVEGKLTIYTSQPEADIQALVEAYNKKYPFGHDKIAVANGEQCEKPSYLCGCNEGYMFIRTKADKIHIIETDRILEIDGHAIIK